MTDTTSKVIVGELVPQTVQEASQTLATRCELGRFIKGHSGNPTGRPIGSKNRTTIMRELLDEAALGEVAKEYVQVVWAMIRRAKAGDVAAAKFVQQIAQIAQAGDQTPGNRPEIRVVIENFTITNDAE